MPSSIRQLRPLGSTGRLVSPLGIGGAYLGVSRSDGVYTVDEEQGVATVLKALELGINLIDTSAGYISGGRSEAIVGQAIAQWARNGGNREDLVLETKTGTRERRARTAASYSARATWESIETSLKLLSVDYLDVALVHDPMSLEPVLAPDGAWAALKEMRSQGLVKAIGLGTRSHEHHQRMIATGDCDVCLTHSDFQLIRQEARGGVLQPAAERGVGVLNGTALAHGMLLGLEPPTELAARFGERWRFALSRDPELSTAVERAQRLYDWSRARHLDLLALNLQYIAREARIAATLLGASTPEQVAIDVAALTTRFPDAIWCELFDAFPWLREDQNQDEQTGGG